MSPGQTRNVDRGDRLVRQPPADEFGLVVAELGQLRITVTVNQRKRVARAQTVVTGRV